MNEIKTLVNNIENNITLDFANNFEPTDSQGCEMAGVVEYNGTKYSVELSCHDSNPYETQAALQIANQITLSQHHV